MNEPIDREQAKARFMTAKEDWLVARDAWLDEPDNEEKASEERRTRTAVNHLAKAAGKDKIERPRRRNKWEQLVHEHRATPQPPRRTEEYKEWLRRKNAYNHAKKMIESSQNNWYVKVMKRESVERKIQEANDAKRIRFYDIMNPRTIYESVGDCLKYNKFSRTRVMTLLRKGRYVRIGLTDEVPAEVIKAHDDGTLMDQLHRGGDVFLPPDALGLNLNRRS